MKMLETYVKGLGLKKPVSLKILVKGNKELDAVYEPHYSDTGKLKKHKITIWIKGAQRDMDTLIVHELIHAWQEENYPASKTHGKRFQKMAETLSARYNLPELYIPSRDT